MCNTFVVMVLKYRSISFSIGQSKMEGVPTKIRGQVILNEMTACKQLLKLFGKQSMYQVL